MTRKINMEEAFQAIDLLLDRMIDGLSEPLDPEIHKAIGVVDKWMNQEKRRPCSRVMLGDASEQVPPGG